jgi:hypothetical protein
VVEITVEFLKISPELSSRHVILVEKGVWPIFGQMVLGANKGVLPVA